jgi:phosphopantothenoylcysteine decarboxylase/phosphopantothenate--cysteine ligase
MAGILITSGPTRQYLDPVRYLTNGSSGKMGSALAAAALELGHRVTIVSGPVNVEYPAAAEVIRVLTTEEMFTACMERFAEFDGVIGAAAPCDYRPVKVAEHKLSKTGEPLLLQLVETQDIIAALGSRKQSHQWVVGFALETDDARFKAITKLERKHCDWIVLNGPQAMDSESNSIEVFDADGETVLRTEGNKSQVARAIMRAIQDELISLVDEEPSTDEEQGFE